MIVTIFKSKGHFIKNNITSLKQTGHNERIGWRWFMTLNRLHWGSGLRGIASVVAAFRSRLHFLPFGMQRTSTRLNIEMIEERGGCRSGKQPCKVHLAYLKAEWYRMIPRILHVKLIRKNMFTEATLILFKANIMQRCTADPIRDVLWWSTASLEITDVISNIFYWHTDLIKSCT